MKKIVLMPVKNEAWILDYTLSCLSLWADHIIVADQGSTDGSRQLYAKYPKVRMIENRAEFHSSTVRKLLLDAARDFAGHNALFSFDADELPTSGILDAAFWQRIAELPPGAAVAFMWLNLWRSTEQYRVGSSVFAPQWKVFGVIDDRRTDYSYGGVINDHAPRVAYAREAPIERVAQVKVLHYQFVSWERVQLKQVQYRMTEWIQKEHSFLTALKINLKYFPSKDERELALQSVNPLWISPYEAYDNKVALSDTGADLRRAVEDMLRAKGIEYFTPLDIWKVPALAAYVPRSNLPFTSRCRIAYWQLAHKSVPFLYALYRRLSKR